MRTLGMVLQVVCLLLPAASLAAPPTPTIGTPEVWATGLLGPEGVAFTKDRRLVVGSVTGRVTAFDRSGTPTVVAELGDPLAGITVRRDGSILAASVAADRVWTIDPKTGATAILASGMGGPNFVVETKRRRVLASASGAGTVVDITEGTPFVKASGLAFPNGMAIGREKRQRWLYLAELGAQRIVRMRINKDESLGPPEVYATGVFLPDGIALDKKGNLLVVGGGRLDVVLAGTRQVVTLATDPPLDAPSNLAFGRGRGFKKRDLYLVNFGAPLGSGMDILYVPYNIRGAKLIQ